MYKYIYINIHQYKVRRAFHKTDLDNHSKKKNQYLLCTSLRNLIYYLL